MITVAEYREVAVTEEHEVRDLEELLAQLDRAADTRHRRITVDEIVHAVGARSFAPLLLLAGVVIASPLSGIPALPTVAAAFILLVCLQMLAGRKHFWLPPWLLRRAVSRAGMRTAVAWMQPPARVIDRFIRPRLLVLVGGPATYVVAVICLSIAACMPVMEFIPFSSSVAGFAITAFGLALVAHDGVLALLAYVLTGLALGLILMGLM